MKQNIIYRITIILMALFMAACNILPTPTEMEEIEIDVEIIEIEELERIEYFRPGALEHILEGELNQRGDAVGFHYEGLPSAKGSVIEGTRTDPDKYGVYEAEVEVEGVTKQGNNGISSFFPLHWNAQEVIDAINEAYETKQFLTGNTYEGLTKEGMIIHMYLDDEEQIISAFPIL